MFFFINHYTVLSVEEDATAADIRSSWRQLVLRLHPDHSEESLRDENTRRFRVVQEAYEVLSNDQERAKFDQGLGQYFETGYVEEDEVRRKGAPSPFDALPSERHKVQLSHPPPPPSFHPPPPPQFHPPPGEPTPEPLDETRYYHIHHEYIQMPRGSLGSFSADRASLFPDDYLWTSLFPDDHVFNSFAEPWVDEEWIDEERDPSNIIPLVTETDVLGNLSLVDNIDLDPQVVRAEDVRAKQERMEQARQARLEELEQRTQELEQIEQDLRARIAQTAWGRPLPSQGSSAWEGPQTWERRQPEPTPARKLPALGSKSLRKNESE